VRFSSISKVSLIFTLALVISGCRKGPPRAPSIGEAYVGPAILKILADVAVPTSVVATAHHGDKLEILTRRRRFMKVRTPNGSEGWTDERLLLATEDMDYLRDLAEKAAKMPPQGQGTTYAELNVHTQPSKSAPSFFQIREKEKVDVLANVVTPRVDTPRKPLIPPAPKKSKKAVKKAPAHEPKVPLPPMPKPPSPPENWIELSKTDKDDDDSLPAEGVVEKAPVPKEQWSLVRNREGQSGWVLTRRLVMAIPDEVAQYAEGKHIVSYFPLGQIQDGDIRKPVWLWTTSRDRTAPYDFDSFRVFIWSLRRHRYETAYIAREVEGYSPVLLKDVAFALNSRSEAGKYPGFSVCVENDAGQRMRREYVLLTNVIRFAGEHPCEPPIPADALIHQPAALKVAAEPPPEPPKPTISERIKKKLRGLFGK